MSKLSNEKAVQEAAWVFEENQSDAGKMAYSIDVTTGVLHDIEFIESPNAEPRPQDALPELIVVHGISLPPNQFGGEAITQLFTNQLDPAEDPYFDKIKGLRVSAHALIRRDGELIQYVPFQNKAWHAGVSEFAGRSGCNDFSIGIELEGTDETAYTEPQYAVLAQLINALWCTYPVCSSATSSGTTRLLLDARPIPVPIFSGAD